MRWLERFTPDLEGSCLRAHRDQGRAVSGAMTGLLPKVMFLVLPLVALQFDMQDVYSASHWAIRGQPPAFDTPDEDVYLTGRNIMLLSKAAIYCAQHDLHRVVLATLAHNPFPDATAEFFAAMGRALSLGLNHTIEIGTPFATMGKSDVVRLGIELGVPLELTLSCMNPQAGRHCGLCSKCRERRDAFHEAGVADPTAYAVTPVR